MGQPRPDWPDPAPAGAANQLPAASRRRFAEAESARLALLRQAASSAGRSLAERPSFAALWLLLQCFIETGPPARTAVQALIQGEEFSVTDESWASAKNPLPPGKDVKQTAGSFSLVWSYEGSGKPLRIRLGIKLTGEANAAFLRGLEPGDLGALGKEGAQLGSVGNLNQPQRNSSLDLPKAQTLWRDLYDRVAVLPVFRVNNAPPDPEKPVAGKVSVAARLENATLLDWSIKNSDQENSPNEWAGTGPEVRVEWDTVATNRADAAHTLWLHYQYRGAAGVVKKNRTPLTVRLGNGAPRASVNAVVGRDPEQREVLLTVTATRPLLAPACDLWLDSTAADPDLPGIALTNATEQADEFRFVYTRYYSLPRNLPGSLRVRCVAQPVVGEPIVREASFAVPEPIRAGLVLDRSRTGLTGPGNGPVLVTVSANTQIQPDDVVVEVDFPDGKTQRLPAASATRVSDQSLQFPLTISEQHPEGSARIRARIGAVRLRSQLLQVIRSVTTLRGVAAEPSQLLRVGEPTRVLLNYSAPLQQPPLVKVLLNGSTILEGIPCDPEAEPGVYSFSFQPSREGEYRIEPGPTRDELGNPVQIPQELGRTLSALNRDSIRLRPERQPFSVGPNRVLVDALGVGGGLRLTLTRVTAGKPGAPTVVPVERLPGGQLAATVEVAEGEEGDGILEATAPGREAVRRPVRLDGLPPRFQIEGLPALVTTAERLRCQITAFEPLRPASRPRIFVRQGTGAPREGEVEPDPDRPGHWVGSVLVQAVGGDARVHVSGVDLAGNVSGEESFQTVDVRLRQKTPVAVLADRGRWGPGPHTVRILSLGDTLTQAPQLHLLPPGRDPVPLPIPIQMDGDGYRGTFEVPAQYPSGTAVLRVSGSAAGAAQVVLDTQAPRARLALPDIALPGERISILAVIDEPLAQARLQVKITTAAGALTEEPSFRPAGAANRWLAALEVKPEHQSYEFALTGSDQAGLALERVVAGLVVKSAPWQLRTSTLVAGSQEVLRVEALARPSPGGGEPGLVEARLRYRSRVPAWTPVLLRRNSMGGPFLGEFPLDAGVASGDAELVLIVDREEVRRMPVVLDTAPPTFRVTAGATAGRTVVTTTVESGDTLKGAPLLKGVIRGLNRPLTFRPGPDPWTYLAEADVAGAAPGAYRVEVEGRDEAGNLGRGAGLLRVGGPLEVEWITPAKAGIRVDRLNEIRFRVNGLLNQRVVLTLIKVDDPRVRVEAVATLPDVAELRPGPLVATRSLGPALPEDTLEVRVDPTSVLPYGAYRLEVRAQQDSTAPFLAIRNARVEFTFGPPTAGPEGRYAILVAVQEYQNFPRLQNPYRDAAKLRTTLLGHGYLAQNIRVITDSPPPAQLGLGTVEVRGADANSLLNAVQAAANDARNKGVQYLTFSFFGHGAWKEGRNYLIPAGVQLAFLDKLSVTPQEVLQVLNGPTAGKPIPHVLLLIDACRSGAGARLNPTPLDPMNGDTVTAYYSCTQGEESLELLQPQQGSLNFTGGLFTEMFTRLVRRGSFKNWGPFEDELYGLVREAAAQLEGRTQRPDRQAVPSGDAKATLPGFFALQDRSPSPMQATR